MNQVRPMSSRIPDTSRQAIPLEQAAKASGTSIDALRKRLQRGLEEGYKANDGRWRVYVNPAWTPPKTSPDASSQVLDLLLGQIRSRISDKDKIIDVLTAQLAEKDATIHDLIQKIPAPEAHQPQAPQPQADQQAEIDKMCQRIDDQKVLLRRLYDATMRQKIDDQKEIDDQKARLQSIFDITTEPFETTELIEE